MDVFPRRWTAEITGLRDYSETCWLDIQLPDWTSPNLSFPPPPREMEQNDTQTSVHSRQDNPHRHRTQSLAQATRQPPKQHSRIRMTCENTHNILSENACFKTLWAYDLIFNCLYVFFFFTENNLEGIRTLTKVIYTDRTADFIPFLFLFSPKIFTIHMHCFYKDIHYFHQGGKT